MGVKIAMYTEDCCSNFGSAVHRGVGQLGAGGSAIMIVGGGLSGGIGARLSGGDFWVGAAHGLMVSGLNHVAHSGLLGKGIAEGLSSGRIRHWFSSDATATTVTVSGFTGGGVSMEIGSVEATVGVDKGDRMTLLEVGMGAGLEASASINVTKYYYKGAADQFRLSFIAGRSRQVSFGGVTVFGGSYSWSEERFNGHRVVGVGLGVGFGAGISYSIRHTILNFHTDNPLF